MNLKPYEFWKPNASKSLFYTLEVKNCVRDTEASGGYISQRRIHTSNTSVNSNNREIIYRVSTKPFPDYKHLLQENYVEYKQTSVRRVSVVDNFPTRWCISILGFICSSVFGCNISKQVDWERWSDTLATTIAGYHPPWLLFMGVC